MARIPLNGLIEKPEEVRRASWNVSKNNPQRFANASHRATAYSASSLAACSVATRTKPFSQYKTAVRLHLAILRILSLKAPFEAGWCESSSRRLWPSAEEC